MNWLKYKKIYYFSSIIFIAISIFSLTTWGLNLGIDFKGGTILEYKIDNESTIEKLKSEISGKGFEILSVQLTGKNIYMLKLPPLTTDEKEELTSVVSEDLLKDKVEELRYETVGPSVGPELIKKTIYAMAMATGAMLLWIAYQFKSFKFGLSAIFAMFHDTFILIGSFAVFGHYFGASVDFLFVTAVLTTLSFSVHDTIVVFDRIREIQSKHSADLDNIANVALTETMVRSLNNSFTIIFMLSALVLLGGITVRWFATALLVGTILGTYSSPFVAVPLLTTMNKFNGKKWRKK